MVVLNAEGEGVGLRMRIRELSSKSGKLVWPPSWVGCGEGHEMGEEVGGLDGTLVLIERREERLKLTMSLRSGEFFGFLNPWVTPPSVEEVERVLMEQGVGKTIREVGDLAVGER
jgi:hypothetical protein